MAKKSKNNFVSGFVSIVGRPNAGKSTLLNQLVGTKLAIVADKPQTTRTNVLGVWTSDTAQVVFLDTPGIHKSDTPINRRMMQEVRNALEQRDLLLYAADATLEFGDADNRALDMVRKAGTAAFLVLNKVDRVRDKRDILPIIETWSSKHEFREVFPVSAMRGDGIEELRAAIVGAMPNGPAYFPPDHLTDQPQRLLAAELIREKILRATHDEVPHSVAVVIDLWEEKKTLTSISASIFVEREGQKGIVIGTGGAMLKKIGTLARKDIEEMLGRKVFLELFVKVRENWRESRALLDQLDWRQSMAGGEESLDMAPEELESELDESEIDPESAPNQ